MTRLEQSLLYRVDWTAQRFEEGLLALRYYWWCGQYTVIVFFPLIVRRYGFWVLIPVIVDLYDWRYRYQERHSWQNTEGEPRQGWDLVRQLRQEQADRNRALFLESFDAPPRSDSGFNRIVKGTALSPLMDRDPNPWPSVRATAPVVYPTEILKPSEHDTALLIPYEWTPERIST